MPLDARFWRLTRESAPNVAPNAADVVGPFCPHRTFAISFEVMVFNVLTLTLVLAACLAHATWLVFPRDRLIDVVGVVGLERSLGRAVGASSSQVTPLKVLVCLYLYYVYNCCLYI